MVEAGNTVYNQMLNALKADNMLTMIYMMILSMYALFCQPYLLIVYIAWRAAYPSLVNIYFPSSVVIRPLSFFRWKSSLPLLSMPNSLFNSEKPIAFLERISRIFILIGCEMASNFSSST